MAPGSKNGTQRDGRLESVSDGIVTGWAMDHAAPGRRLAIDIVVDDRIVASAIADIPDRGLVQAGKGDGAHVFRIALPEALADGGVHAIAAVVAAEEPSVVPATKSFDGRSRAATSPWTSTRFEARTPGDLRRIYRSEQLAAKSKGRARRPKEKPQESEEIAPAPARDRVQRLTELAADRRSSSSAYAGLLVLGAILIYWLMRGMSIFQDDWDFILYRRDFSTYSLLAPLGPHLSIVPILIYKVMLSVFGMDSFNPWKAMTAINMVLFAGTVGLVTRREWGLWWGLVPVAIMVTLGPGSASLLWPFQVGYAIATAAGFGALVLLSLNRGRRADVLACALILVSLGSASQGVGVLVGGAVIIALHPQRRNRLWVLVIPTLLYAAWFLHYGRDASETDLTRLGEVVPYYVRALATTLAAIFGLARPEYTANTGPLDPQFGIPLAYALLGVIGVALYRGWRPRPLFWGFVATLLFLWTASCLSNVAGSRSPETQRYIPPDVALILMATAVALPRPRPNRIGAAIAGVVLLAICFTNYGVFADSRKQYEKAGHTGRASLGALLIARGVVADDYRMPDGPPTALGAVLAGPFFSAVDAFGTNAYTPAEIIEQTPEARALADSVLIGAEGIVLAFEHAGGAELAASPPRARGTRGADGACAELGSDQAVVTSGAPGVKVAADDSPVEVGVRRFGTGPTELDTVPPGRAAVLRLPADREPDIPWEIFALGDGGQVCALA